MAIFAVVSLSDAMSLTKLESPGEKIALKQLEDRAAAASQGIVKGAANELLPRQWSWFGTRRDGDCE